MLHFVNHKQIEFARRRHTHGSLSPRFVAIAAAALAYSQLGIAPSAAVAVELQIADEVVIQPGQPVFQLSAEQFDSWVFNGQVNGKQWEPQLKSQLNLRIEAIDQVCKLTEAQKQKLTLAGRYDIKRFADQYEALKQKLQGKSYGQDRVNDAFQHVQPLQAAWNAGIFGEKSLLYKILPQVLSPEQTAKYQEEELKRRKFRYLAKVKLTLASLENSMPFTAKQRQQFEALILADTPPPKRWGQYDNQVVLVQAANLPEAKLKEIFDDAQFKRLQATLQQAKRFEAMLVQQGWIEAKP